MIYCPWCLCEGCSPTCPGMPSHEICQNCGSHAQGPPDATTGCNHGLTEPPPMTDPPAKTPDTVASSSYKLEPRHIEAIREGARENRKFIYIYFHQTLNNAIDQLEGPIPGPPHNEGPGDYRFDRLFTVRTSAALNQRLKDIDTNNHGVSHTVRYLLDQAFPPNP